MPSTTIKLQIKSSDKPLFDKFIDCVENIIFKNFIYIINEKVEERSDEGIECSAEYIFGKKINLSLKTFLEEAILKAAEARMLKCKVIIDA